MQVKKSKNGGTAGPWDRGVSFQSSIVAVHNADHHGILTPRKRTSNISKAQAVAGEFDSDGGGNDVAEECVPLPGSIVQFTIPTASPADKRRGRQKLKQMLYYAYSKSFVSASTFNEAEFREMLQEGKMPICNLYA